MPLISRIVLFCACLQSVLGNDIGASMLTLDDECQADDDSCSLNAIQRRGQQVTIQGNSERLAASPKFSAGVACNPLCNQEPDSEEDLRGVDDATSDDSLPRLSSSGIRHYGQDCYKRCGKVAGLCPSFCGQGNACCRYGFPNPDDCAGVRWWPIMHAHTCVTPHPTPTTTTLPSTPASPSPEECSGRASTGAVVTLYHQTGCEQGPLILAEGFKLGRLGWCGGGIYFATTPGATETKAIGIDSKKGFMIEVQVAVGRILRGDNTCKVNGMQLIGSPLHQAGYDTVLFNPGDGDEYVVYCSSQILSMKRYPYGWCP